MKHNEINFAEMEFCRNLFREMKFALDMATVRKLLWSERKVNKGILVLTFINVGHKPQS